MSQPAAAVTAAPISLIACAVEVVAAYVSTNPLPANELPDLIISVHSAICGLPDYYRPFEIPMVAKPAIAIKRSISRDFIVCLDDGKKLKSLRRHLALLGMTPDEYRAKWSLPKDYPMVAPAYSELRSALAKTIGLGRKR